MHLIMLNKNSPFFNQIIPRRTVTEVEIIEVSAKNLGKHQLNAL